MNTQTYRQNNVRRMIKLEFERNYIEVPFDHELRDFFAQVEPNTAKPEDIHVMFCYFHLYWPFKVVRHNDKEINYPQLFRNYRVREIRG